MSRGEVSPDSRVRFSLQTDSESFRKWFGDGKVVEEDGKPLVVHHGTNAEFNAFDRTKSRANMDIQGAFFSPYEDDAMG